MGRKITNLTTIVAVLFLVVAPVRADPGTLYADDDGLCNGNSPCYTTIQDAVNAANPSDTVYVYPGAYNEHVTIGKSLILQGENRETTIINGGGSGDVIYITANYVTVGGIKATNGTNGIELIPNWNIHHVTIRDVIIDSNSGTGISAGHSYSPGAYHLIEDCVISNNGDWGLYAHQFSKSTIQNCDIFGNSRGLDPAWGSDTLVTNNKVHDQKDVGINLDSMTTTIVEKNIVYSNGIGIRVTYVGNNNVIRDNIVHHNGVGISMESPTSGNRVYHNDLIKNTTQADDSKGDNSWDDGYPSGGNYWSDYTGVDKFSGVNQDVPGSDGIGDTPYAFVNNKDNYPLMKPHLTYRAEGKGCFIDKEHRPRWRCGTATLGISNEAEKIILDIGSDFSKSWDVTEHSQWKVIESYLGEDANGEKLRILINHKNGKVTAIEKDLWFRGDLVK